MTTQAGPDTSSTRILVVDDVPDNVDILDARLSSRGYQVVTATNGEEALASVADTPPHLILLDVMMPLMDGYEVARRIKQNDALPFIPIILVTARDSTADKVEGLDAGADDYLTKPFGVSELLARIRAHMRRRNQGGANESPLVRFGAVTVDLALRQVTREGAAIHLTPIEYRLLATLVRHAGRVLTHRQLLRDVWGPSHVESHHYLRIYMAHLRGKLERDPAQPEHIVTETGVGYRLVGAV